MSVILDALKKLEREKAAASRGTDRFSPSFADSHNRRRWPEVWKILLAFAAVAAVSAVATFALMAALSPSGEKVNPGLPQDIENVHHASPLSPASVQADLRGFPDTVGGTRAPGNITVSPRETVASIPLRGTTPVQEPPIPSGKNSAGVSGGGITSNSLIVSGIAWQDERADRRAVVNGALVGEGTVVDGGARIVRIFPESVRFSRGGQTFDVSIAGASGGKLP